MQNCVISLNIGDVYGSIVLESWQLRW